jgi:hypothetical protein
MFRQLNRIEAYYSSFSAESEDLAETQVDLVHTIDVEVLGPEPTLSRICSR